MPSSQSSSLQSREKTSSNCACYYRIAAEQPWTQASNQPHCVTEAGAGYHPSLEALRNQCSSCYPSVTGLWA